MPKLIYKPRRDIPNAVRYLHTFSPTEIREWVLDRFNKSITPQSITMWLKRNPDIKKQLKQEIVKKELPLKEVRESVFETGTFEIFDSVDVWIRDMKRRKLRQRTINANISALKRLCKGYFKLKKIDLREKGWSYKHPDRLTLENCIEFIDLMNEHYPDVDLSTLRLAMRNFLDSKGIHVGAKISGAKHISAGKYARLFVNKNVLEDILEEIELNSYEAYVASNFMYQTGARISATLDARLEEIRVEGDYREIRIYDKGRRSKYPKGHPWDKALHSELFSEIKAITGFPHKRRTGKIFQIKAIELREITREALETFCPEVLEQYPSLMVCHFWRHMFAQHMLRMTEWNYGIVASLGGWTVKALEESYGKPPRAIVREWGLSKIPELRAY